MTSSSGREVTSRDTCREAEQFRIKEEENGEVRGRGV